LQACVTHWIARPCAKDLGALRGAPFARVLVHDSSCVALTAAHADAFPGPANQSGRAQASLRVQVLYDLLAERFVQFLLTPFTRNDQAAAGDVLPLLRRDDLLVRDLGYFSLPRFGHIAALGAFFLSRWRFGVCLHDPATGQPLGLRTLLRPGATLDRPVLLANGCCVRLLALPLDERTAAARRRLARANRDRRLRHSDDYYYLLGWTLLITNAPATRLPLSLAACVYRLRWRIEIVFKSWKSHLGLLHASRCGRAQLLPLVLALLLFALLLHSLLPPAAHTSAPFSVLKLAALFATFLLPLCLAHLTPADALRRFSSQLLRHGRYEVRSRLDYPTLKRLALS
jgi:hypothetical protein